MSKILATYEKRPGASIILDFPIDWSDWLEGKTITSSAWAISGIDSNLTVSGSSNTDTETIVYLAGGTNGAEYEVKNTITTDTSSVADYRVIKIKIRH